MIVLERALGGVGNPDRLELEFQTAWYGEWLRKPAGQRIGVGNMKPVFGDLGSARSRHVDWPRDSALSAVAALLSITSLPTFLIAQPVRETVYAVPTTASGERPIAIDGDRRGHVPHLPHEGGDGDIIEAVARLGMAVDVVLISKRSLVEPGGRVPVTEYTFRVVEQFSGEALASEFALREVGGEVGDGTESFTCHSHRLEVDGRYFLLLHEDAFQTRLPFRRVLQILDNGAVLADEGGDVARLGPDGNVGFVFGGDGMRHVHYRKASRPAGSETQLLMDAPKGQAGFGDGVVTPAPVLSELSAGEFLSILRTPGKAAPLAPAGLPAKRAPFDDRGMICGWIDNSMNFYANMPDNNGWNWYNQAGSDWNALVDSSGGKKWMFGYYTSGGNPIRNEPIGYANGRNNVAAPTESQMTAGGYQNWSQLGSAIGVCFETRQVECGRTLEADVFVKPDMLANGDKFVAVMTHELGHSTGLDHEDKYPANMATRAHQSAHPSSWIYSQADDTNAMRGIIDFANSVTPGTFTKRWWSDLATASESHPSWGVATTANYLPVTTSQYSARPGDFLWLKDLLVENRGNDPAGRTDLNVYLRPLAGGADTLVGSVYWSNYPASSVTNRLSVPLYIPLTLPSGDYYITWLVVPTNSDLSFGNNYEFMKWGGFGSSENRIFHVYPWNDRCDSAQRISENTSIRYDASGAWYGFSPLTRCGPLLGPKLWWEYDNSGRGIAAVTVWGSMPPEAKVAVYPSCDGSSNDYQEIACASWGGVQAHVTFLAQPGAQFRIVLANPGVGSLYLERQDCPGDFNSDGMVDDADFAGFVFEYSRLLCPWIGMGECKGDINRDSMVDDADFTFFLAAYNEMVCE